MRELMANEQHAVSGGDGVLSAGFGAPRCPPGYVGIILQSQTTSVTGPGGGATIGLTPLPSASGQITVPTMTNSTTTQQVCLPELVNSSQSSASAPWVSGYDLPCMESQNSNTDGDEDEV
jgi:hypothetical protein